MFLKIARNGYNEWWRYLVTIILVVAGVILGQLPLYVALLIVGNRQQLDDFEIAEMAESMDFSRIGFDQNLTVFLMLLAFVFGFFALWLFVQVIHKRSFKTLVTPYARINWKKILYSFGLWIVLTLVMELIFYALHPENYSLQFDPSSFFVLLLIALFIFPLQTSFEELFFRGYLMQGISMVAAYRWIPLLITSVAFGAMHFMNPEVQAFGMGISMAYYIGVGLFLGFLTLMDDSLELALGIHAATNIYSALIVTFDDSAVQTAALFHTDSVNMPLMLAAFIVAAIIFTVIVSKKYQWNDWSKWYGFIEKTQTEQTEIEKL